MSDLLNWVKENSKEGVDIAQAETLINGLNPLNGVESVDSAITLIKGNDMLNRAFDSMQSKAAATHDEKFQADKLPGILKEEREKLRLELNPEETPEQKRIRDLEDMVKASNAKEARTTLENSLSKKAEELKFDPVKARDYAVYGESAVEKLEADSKWFNEQLESRLSSELKGQYTSKKPSVSSNPNARTITRADFDSMSIAERANLNFKEVSISG